MELWTRCSPVVPEQLSESARLVRGKALLVVVGWLSASIMGEIDDHLLRGESTNAH